MISCENGKIRASGSSKELIADLVVIVSSVYGSLTSAGLKQEDAKIIIDAAVCSGFILREFGPTIRGVHINKTELKKQLEEMENNVSDSDTNQ